MADDELVETLAQRLAKMSEDLPYLDDFDTKENPAWSALARECLRQMEWARRRGIRFGLVARGLRQGLVADSISGEQEIDGMAARDPITIAPDGWTPSDG